MYKRQSNDLPENWYDFIIISSDNQVQEGSFYSYGNSSGNNSSIMNIAQATVEDSEEEGELSLDCEDGPCNDAAFITYIGSPDEENSIPDVTIDIHHFYEENGNWDHYATTYTNESGQAVEYNLVCGEYTWDAHYEGNYINSGYFLVLANCDSEDSNDAYAWFESLSYNLEDRDGDNQEDSININYMVRSSDCDCEMDLLIILDIFDESGNMVDTFEENYTIAANDNMDFSFIWENNFGDGEFTFNSLLEYLVDGDTNGEIIVQEEASETFYLANVNDEPAFNIEDVTGRDNVFEGQNIELGLVLSGTNDVVVDWYMGDGMAYQNVFNVYHTYQQSGNYEIMVHVYDDDNSVEEYFEINVRNMAPTILSIMMDDIVNEGDEVSFNVQYQDVPMDIDNISVMWVFPDGVLLGNFVQYTFADDGEFLVSVEVKDDDGGSSIEQRMITVQNVAPTFTEFILPSQGEQGVAMDFKVSATDPGDDTITYTFDFGDGTAQLITQNGNASHKFASGDTFEIIICAIDEDGGETCRTEVIPVALLEQIEDSGLPGFGFLGVISALGAITLLRRRTH